MRLFVGVWPPPGVRDALAALPRPPDPAVRWTSPDQWHVTLRFLGEVAEADVSDLLATLRGVADRHGPREARAGPATARLGRGNLVVPVRGLDDLGVAVAAATAGVGRPPEDRPFAGHLTVARGRGRRPLPAGLAGRPIDVPWPVAAIALVRSHTDRSGARYETVATVPLA